MKKYLIALFIFACPIAAQNVYINVDGTLKSKFRIGKADYLYIVPTDTGAALIEFPDSTITVASREWVIGRGTVLPSQTGKANKYLKTNGTTAYWCNPWGEIITVEPIKFDSTLKKIYINTTGRMQLGDLYLSDTLNVTGRSAFASLMRVNNNLVSTGRGYFTDLYLSDTLNVAGLTYLSNDVMQTGNKSFYNNYVSGILGSGWKLWYDANGAQMELDNLTIRNTLRTHIFQKDIVKATNGYLYVTDSGIISYINSGTNRVGFSDDNSATFDPGDQLWVKDITDDGTWVSVKFTIVSTYSSSGGQTIYNVTVGLSSLSYLEEGMTAVRISGANILLDASSTYAPFVDIYNAGTLYGRYGYLAGVTDADFGGSLSGYGLYTTNAYLKGYLWLNGWIKTGYSGARIEMNVNPNQIDFYNATSGYASIKGSWLSTGANVQIGGDLSITDDLYLTAASGIIGFVRDGGATIDGVIAASATTGKYNLNNIYGISGGGDWVTTGSIRADGGYVIGLNTIITADRDVQNIDDLSVSDVFTTTVTATGQISALEFDGSTSSDYRLNNTVFADWNATYSKIDLTNISNATISEYATAKNIWLPAYGELYDEVATSTITTDASTYVQWTGTTVGVTSRISGSTSTDRLTVDTGHGGRYLVVYSVTFKANASDSYIWAAKDRSNAIGESRKSVYVTDVNTEYAIAGQAIRELSAGDYVTLGCLSGWGHTVTVIRATLSIVKISNVE